MLYPVPAVMVSCMGSDLKPNIITIAWTGTVNSIPPMAYVSVRRERYSFHLIEESGEFVINIPSAGQLREMDYCGVVSGRDVDKFAAANLTPAQTKFLKTPLIKECPVNIECRVHQAIELGSHSMFIGTVMAVHVDQEKLDSKGAPDYEALQAVAYIGSSYWSVTGKIGVHGFSKKGSR